MSTFLLAATVAGLTGALSFTPPQHTIDQVLDRFVATHAGATVTGIDFDREEPQFRHWDVYFVRNRAVMEVEISDVNLSASQPERLRQRPLASRLTFRQALARTRQLQPGLVFSLELERDPRKGVIWSAEVRHENLTWELYISPRDGRLLKRELVPDGPSNDDL